MRPDARRRPDPDGLVDPLLDLGAAGTALQVDEELAVALRAEQRRGDHRSRAEPDAASRLDGPAEDLAMHLRIADDAVVRPTATRLELRLHEGHDLAARRQRGGHGPEDQMQRDE
jgi:hypothetical protein